MSGAAKFRRVTPADVNEQLRAVLVERLGARAAGHCMRVSDLIPMSCWLWRESSATLSGTAAQVHVLSSEARNDDPLLIGSSKSVELRNPPAEDTQRPPLLVFVPKDVRVPAEDSFAEATFEQLSVADA